VAAASVARAPAAIVIQDLLKGAKANQQGCRTGSAPSWDRGLDRAGWIEFVMLRQKKKQCCLCRTRTAGEQARLERRDVRALELTRSEQRLSRLSSRPGEGCVWRADDGVCRGKATCSARRQAASIGIRNEASSSSTPPTLAATTRRSRCFSSQNSKLTSRHPQPAAPLRLEAIPSQLQRIPSRVESPSS